MYGWAVQMEDFALRRGGEPVCDDTTVQTMARFQHNVTSFRTNGSRIISPNKFSDVRINLNNGVVLGRMNAKVVERYRRSCSQWLGKTLLLRGEVIRKVGAE